MLCTQTCICAATCVHACAWKWLNCVRHAATLSWPPLPPFLCVCWCTRPGVTCPTAGCANPCIDAHMHNCDACMRCPPAAQRMWSAAEVRCCTQACPSLLAGPCSRAHSSRRLSGACATRLLLPQTHGGRIWTAERWWLGKNRRGGEANPLRRMRDAAMTSCIRIVLLLAAEGA